MMREVRIVILRLHTDNQYQRQDCNQSECQETFVEHDAPPTTGIVMQPE